MKKKSKALSQYLPESPPPIEIILITLRIPKRLHKRVYDLATKHSVSLNTTLVSVIEKVCDEEGV